MRLFITLTVSLSVLIGSYLIAFGVPDFVSTGADSAIDGEIAAEPRPGPAASQGPGGGRMGGAATSVVLTPLENEPYDDILRAIGSAKAVNSAEVVANASGAIVETNLDPNQHVSAGDVLVKLDARVEKYNLEIAQTDLDQATEVVERYEQLRANGNSTITEVTMSEAQTAQRLAEAQVGLAQAALDDRTILAPISGKLGLSDLKVGDILSNGSPVATIDDMQALLVEFELPERSIGLLTQEQKVLLITPAFVGQVFEGRITSFDSRIDSVTRSVTTEAIIDNLDDRLWPGMTFAVRIIRQSDPLPVLPSTAITWTRDGSSVWVDNDGIAEPVPVTILFRRDERVWIEAEIPVGTLVVTEGAQKLREGSRITQNLEDAATPAPDAPQSMSERSARREGRK